jgi:hypothetical protein
VQGFGAAEMHAQRRRRVPLFVHFGRERQLAGILSTVLSPGRGSRDCRSFRISVKERQASWHPTRPRMTHAVRLLILPILTLHTPPS